MDQIPGYHMWQDLNRETLLISIIKGLGMQAGTTTVCLACVKPLGCLIDSMQKIFHKKNPGESWVWLLTPAIPVLGRLRKKDQEVRQSEFVLQSEFEASLGKTEKPCLKIHTCHASVCACMLAHAHSSPFPSTPNRKKAVRAGVWYWVRACSPAPKQISKTSQQGGLNVLSLRVGLQLSHVWDTTEQLGLWESQGWALIWCFSFVMKKGLAVLPRLNSQSPCLLLLNAGVPGMGRQTCCLVFIFEVSKPCLTSVAGRPTPPFVCV